MRFSLPIYNPVKECNACIQHEEKEVSAHILAYQVANQLIKLIMSPIRASFREKKRK